MKLSKLFLATSVALSALLATAQEASAPADARTDAQDGDLVVRAAELHTVSGEVLTEGVVVIRDGLITAVGPAATTAVPDGLPVIEVPVATPGLIDAHSVVGLAGYLNQDHDQDQLERSEPMQPELRALDAYNARERLVAWVRSFGVTTLHSGHGPGALISGETLVVKTTGDTVDEALVEARAMVAATLGDASQRDGRESPGTRGKQVAMLRGLFVQGQAYAAKLAAGEEVDVDLRLEAVARLLRREVPLLVTAQRHQDILAALRLAAEFELELVLDGAAEAHLLLDELAAAGVSVLVHPTMMRAAGETENLSMENAAKLADAGIPIALQSGFESYVPKTRVVLFEAAVAAANGLGRERALAAITLDAARLLGIDDRVGSLEVGKHGDLAFYDGDPFEYTSHCLGTVIEGRVVSRERR